jgi:hypothetical protein
VSLLMLGVVALFPLLLLALLLLTSGLEGRVVQSGAKSHAEQRPRGPE